MNEFDQIYESLPGGPNKSTNTPPTRPSIWKGPIASKEAAEKVLNDSAKGWYALAAIQVVVGAFMALMKQDTLMWVDAPFQALAGYCLPKFKSRAFALFTLLYAFVVLGAALSNRRNIVLAGLVVWMAYRGVQATFAFHKHVGSRIVWKGVIITTCAATGIIVVNFILTIVLFVYLESNGLAKLSEDEQAVLFFMVSMLGLGACFLFLPRKFPLISVTKPLVTQNYKDPIR